MKRGIAFALFLAIAHIPRKKKGLKDLRAFTFFKPLSP